MLKVIQTYMSKYQYIPKINNPNIAVPAGIIDGFYLALSEGNVDAVRKYIRDNKNKINLLSNVDKTNPSLGHRNPFHTVLSLDPLIASDSKKLQLMRYLNEIQAPMDLPSEDNVWPIHLAAQSQSPELVEFFVKNKVNLNRTDSSGNSPLHYAIYGKEVSCPNVSKIGQLNKELDNTSKNFNKNLTSANEIITKLLGNNPQINNNLIHIINTIAKTPEMFISSEKQITLNEDIVKIFTDFALDSNYPSGSVLNSAQQTALESLVDKWTIQLKNSTYKYVTSDIPIKKNSLGWGPLLPGETDSQNGIFEKYLQSYLKNMSKIYIDNKTNIIGVNSNFVNKTLHNIADDVENITYSDYLSDLLLSVDYDDKYRVNFFLLKTYVALTINAMISDPDIISQEITELITDEFYILDMSAISSLINGGALPSIASKQLISTEDLIIYQSLSDDYQFNEVFKTYYNNNNPQPASSILYKVLYTITDPDSYSLQPMNTGFEPLVIGNSGLKIPITDVGRRFPKYQEEINNFITGNIFPPRATWISILERFIQEVQPNPIGLNPNIFSNNLARPIPLGLPLRNNLYIVNDKNTGKARLFNGQVRKTINIQNNKYADNINNYTLWEVSRALDMLTDFIEFGSYSPFKIVNSFFVDSNGGIPINKMMDRVNEIDNSYAYLSNQTIGEKYPVFIFLLRIFISYVQFYVKKAINSSVKVDLQNAKDDTTDTTVAQYFGNLNDMYYYTLILPSYPDISDIINNPVYDPYKNIIWDDDHPLVEKYNANYTKNYPNNSHVIKKIFEFLESGMYKDYNSTSKLNQKIEILYVELNNDTTGILKNVRFINPVDYLSENKKDINEIITNVKLYDLSTVYNFMLKRSSYIKNDGLIAMEIVGNFMISTKEILYNFGINFGNINQSIIHITSLINYSDYYHIPQIILPAIVKMVLLGKNELIILKNKIDTYENIKNIQLKKIIQKGILETYSLGDKFANKIKGYAEVYEKILSQIIKYHNDVIDFLNIHSAYQIITYINTNVNPNNIVKFFTFPLTKFPENIPADLEGVKALSQQYFIPKITYYADPNDKNIEVNIYTDDNNNLTKYKDIIDYDRTSIKVSDSPTNGLNRQINIVIPGTTGSYDLNDILSPQSGPWLNVDVFDLKKTSYADAFIAYITSTYSYNSLSGAPASIEPLASPYLQMKKQEVIQDFIQYVTDNKTTDLEAGNLYNFIKAATSQPGYIAADEVINYIVLAKLVQDNLNILIEYSIRQSVSNWIYKSINDTPYKSLSDTINNTVNMINDNTYNRLTLNKIDPDLINNVLQTNPNEVDLKLKQIEADPDNLEYTTQKRRFINHIQSIDYDNDTEGDTTKCYQVDPEIAKMLITPDTINKKNSDGKTPLALAVETNNVELIKLLKSRGAIADSFNDLRDKSPLFNSRTELNDHLEYTRGETNRKTIDNFAITFNDLMISRINNAENKNNIIKNITLGIPIQLVMYNHMFHMYLQNYRYGFDINLKKSIINIISKYYNPGYNITAFPWDLYLINDNSVIETIIESSQPPQRANNAIVKNNSALLDANKKQIDILENQIDGLQKEKMQETDPKKIQIIDNFLDQLDIHLNDLKMERSKLTTPVYNTNNTNNIFAPLYRHTISNAISNINDRNMDLTEFYDYVQGRLSSSNEMYLNIWQNYLQKNLNDSPSMIFSLLDNLIPKILDGHKEDLNAITSFYQKSAEYIQSKNQYPNNYDDNPILIEEAKHIIYIINLILTPAIRNILYNQIYQNLENINTINTTRAQTMMDIINTKFNKQTIDSYLKDILPMVAIKYFTSTYSDLDPERRITTVEDIFTPIQQILISNKSIQISEESQIIVNFKESLVPLFSNTYQNFIHHLRFSIYSYEKYITNTSRLLKVYNAIKN